MRSFSSVSARRLGVQDREIFPERRADVSEADALRAEQRGSCVGSAHREQSAAGASQSALRGAYTYGRTRTSIGAEGRVIFKELPRREWHALIRDAHAGYITWEEYERNRDWLDRNIQAQVGKRRCPPREGPALLQGLAVCGLCGRRMTVRYHNRRGGITPEYLCHVWEIRPPCRSVKPSPATNDEAVGDLLMEVMTPVALEVSLAVQQEIQIRFEEADNLRLRQVERCRYDADFAKRRYMKVDPDNRLVAEELEAEWNLKLRALREAEEGYKDRRAKEELVIDNEKREKILSLTSSFPKLWGNPKTPQRERKRMIQLLIEDVTLVKADIITANVRFKGGATRELSLPRPLFPWEEWKTSEEVLAEIDRLLDNHTYGEIATLLNERGLTTGGGKKLDGYRVKRIRRGYKLRSRESRLHERGLMTLEEASEMLGFCKAIVNANAPRECSNGCA